MKFTYLLRTLSLEKNLMGLQNIQGEKCTQVIKISIHLILKTLKNHTTQI